MQTTTKQGKTEYVALRYLGLGFRCAEQSKKAPSLSERLRLWKQWRQEASVEIGCHRTLRKVRRASQVRPTMGTGSDPRLGTPPDGAGLVGALRVASAAS